MVAVAPRRLRGEAMQFEIHWGDFGGPQRARMGKFGLRMGKLSKQPWPGRGMATGVFCRGYVENKGVNVAPQVGFEPTTLRLIAERLIAASHCKHET